MPIPPDLSTACQAGNTVRCTVPSAVPMVTWNVWGRYGSEWQTRQVALEAALAEVGPDVICLVESWGHGESSQPGRIADRLGLRPTTNSWATGSRKTGCRGSAWSADGR